MLLFYISIHFHKYIKRHISIKHTSKAINYLRVYLNYNLRNGNAATLGYR